MDILCSLHYLGHNRSFTSSFKTTTTHEKCRGRALFHRLSWIYSPLESTQNQSKKSQLRINSIDKSPYICIRSLKRLLLAIILIIYIWDLSLDCEGGKRQVKEFGQWRYSIGFIFSYLFISSYVHMSDILGLLWTKFVWVRIFIKLLYGIVGM